MYCFFLVLLCMILSSANFCRAALPTTNATASVRSWSLDEKNIRGNLLRISQKDMLRINAANLWKAMTLAPGVMQYMTGLRNESGISIRGFRTSQIQVMMDGVPVYIPYDGNEDYSRYLVGDLESIEVSKGYSSVHTGGNSLGGTIDMRSSRPKERLEFSARYVNYFDERGEDMARHVMLSAGTRQELFYLKATGLFDEKDFYRIAGSFDGSPEYALYSPAHRNQGEGKREFSAHRDKKLNIQAGLTPTEEAEIALGYIAQRGVKQRPPYAGTQRENESDHVLRNWDWPEIDKDTVSLRTRLSPHKDIIIKANLYHDTYKSVQRNYRRDWAHALADSKVQYDDHAYGGIVEIAYALNEMHSVILSGSYRRDVHKRKAAQLVSRNSTPATPWLKTREMADDIWTGAVEYIFKPVKNLTLTLGGSYTRLKPVKADEFLGQTGYSLTKGNGEEAFNGQAGLFWDVNQNHQVYATVAHKTRMPTMEERYRFGIHTTGAPTRMPNPDLEPEKAVHIETGWHGKIQDKIKLHAALFFSEVRDLILDTPVRSPANFLTIIPQTQNRGRAPFFGTEVSIDFDATDWLSFGGSFTYLDWNIHNADTELSDLRITALPHVKANGYVLVKPLDGLSLLSRLDYLSESYFSSTRKDTTSGFTLVHFKAEYALFEYLTLEAGVENIFDRYYEYDEGYPMPGRTYFLGMNLDF